MAAHDELETQWTGHDLYDKNGEKIGTIEDIRIGELVTNLKWLVVRTGFLGSKLAFVPANEVESSGGKLVTSLSKDQVRDSPHVKQELASLPSVEEKLCKFYGLDYVRSVSAPAEGCVDPKEEA
jgi:sporulation protein YlmC with PRC-barrel domain